MRVLVTGASGVFGRVVMAELLQRGHEVVGFSRSVPRPMPAGATHIAGDITDADAVRRAVDGCDTVAHCAWMLDTPLDRAEEEAVNIGGTEHVLDAMSRSGARRIVFASSVTAYGPRPAGAPRCTEDEPLAPTPGHTYAEDKARVEERLAAASVDAVVIRGAIVMGRKIDNRVLAGFANPVLPVPKGHRVLLQVVHDDDVGRFFARACEPGPVGTVNLAAADVLEFAEVGRLLGRCVVEVSPDRLRAGARAAFARGWSDVSPEELEFTFGMPVVDTTRLTEEWGYTPAFTSRETVADTRMAVEGRHVLGKKTLELPWRGRRAGSLEREVARAQALAADVRGLSDDRLESVRALADDLAGAAPAVRGARGRRAGATAARLRADLDAERARRETPDRSRVS